MRKNALSARCFVILAAAVCLFIAATLANAQTPKKKRVTKTSASTSATLPANAEPAIVSRADDYQDSSEIIEPIQKPIQQNSADEGDNTTRRIKELQSRIRKLEAGQKNDYDEKQKRLLLNLDILSKAEQRSDSLRRQRFELLEKENSIRSRIDQIDADSRPETIERSVAMVGTLRPEELRDARRKSLEAEKRNLQSLLNEIQSTRVTLEQTLLRADAMVEKLRTKLEKDIDNALTDDSPDQ